MDGKVVEKLTTEEARKLLPKTGFGMQKKILAGVEAVEAGVGEAIIASGFGPEPLSKALTHDGCTVMSRA